LSELLKRDRIAEPDRAQTYHFLHQESHRLRRLVEALLDFGRLESGKMEFRFERTNAAVLVNQTVTQFAEGDAHRRHHLEVSTSGGPHWIDADAETLRCVIWNLLENAVKYSPDCDTVWVSLSALNRNVEIDVRDRGIGIPGPEQQRIFEKFVRGSTANVSLVRGTGIGLATANKIVRAHGGNITVESEPGKGSTFRVSLPMSNGNRHT
jgi:two-component system, OmpR family, phosphate regulon sensor histidine kinase PhoR